MSATTPPGLHVPATQLGSGMVATMLATGLDHTPHLPFTASQPSIAQPGFGTASVLSQPGLARQHSAASHLSLPAASTQQHPNPFMGRQNSTPGQLQGISQQDIFQQGPSQQGKAAVHMSSGLLPQPGSLPAALSGNSSFTSLLPSQASVTQPALSLSWQQQTHAQTLNILQAASLLGQHSHMPASSSGPITDVPKSAGQLQTSAFQIDTHFLQDLVPANSGLVPSDVKSEPGIEAVGCDTIDHMSIETPAAGQSGSGQGSAALQFDVADHGLESLDFLGGTDLDLDHSGALDFDPDDCMF